MKLFEVVSKIKLSSVEEGILVTIFNSTNKKEAFDNVNGTQQLVVSRNILKNYGLIKTNKDSAIITNVGKDVMIRYSLIENGKLTDYGKTVLSQYVDNVSHWKTTF